MPSKTNLAVDARCLIGVKKKHKKETETKKGISLTCSDLNYRQKPTVVPDGLSIVAMNHLHQLDLSCCMDPALGPPEWDAFASLCPRTKAGSSAGIQRATLQRAH